MLRITRLYYASSPLKLRAPDPTLVAFPTDTLSDCVQVFRNVVNSDDESRIAEDLSVVLDKDSEIAYAAANFKEGRVVRNRGIDLYGYEPHIKIRDWNKMTDRVVKGLVWSPTLANFCKEVAPICLKYDYSDVCTNARAAAFGSNDSGTQIQNTNNKTEMEKNKKLLHEAIQKEHSEHVKKLIKELEELKLKEKKEKEEENQKKKNENGQDDENKKKQEQEKEQQFHAAPTKNDILIPDTAKIIEHQVPGYEMHIEQPIVGSVYLILNLLSPTVISFDDESTNRMGEVLLPERSLMRISGEVRWGWRWGERFDSLHTFSMTRRQIRPSLRLSVGIFKYAKHLVDQRKLQETVEAGAKRIAETDKEQTEKEQAQKRLEKLEKAASEGKTLASLELEDNESSSSTSASTEKEKKVVLSEEEKKKKAAAEKAEEEAFAHNVLKGQGFLGGDLPTGSSAVKRATELGTSPDQIGATPADRMKRFHGYTEDLGRIGHFMKKMNTQQQDSSRQVSDAELHSEINKLRASSSVDDGFIYDMDHLNMTWENMEEMSKQHKQKLQQMTYDALHDTTVETEDGEDLLSGDSQGNNNEGKPLAAVPPPRKLKTMSKKDAPNFFAEKSNPFSSSGSGDGTTTTTGKPSFEETLKKVKESGMNRDELESLNQGLEVEAFDPAKAAENISKNWLGKTKNHPGMKQQQQQNVSPPPPPAGLQ